MYHALPTKRELTKNQVNEFLFWLRSHGLKMHKKFRICKVKGKNKGYGLVARESIKRGDTLFTLPKTTCFYLNRLNTIKDKVYRNYAKENRRRNRNNPFFDEDAVFRLIYERFVIGENSFWMPYFNVLPPLEHFMQFPAYYPPDKQHVLQGTILANEIEKIQTMIKIVLVKLKQLNLRYPRRFPEFTMDMVKWATAIIETRGWAFHQPPYQPNSHVPRRSKKRKKPRKIKRYLFPLFDFINSGHLPKNASHLSTNLMHGRLCQSSTHDADDGDEIILGCQYLNFTQHFARYGYFSTSNMAQWTTYVFSRYLKGGLCRRSITVPLRTIDDFVGGGKYHLLGEKGVYFMRLLEESDENGDPKKVTVEPEPSPAQREDDAGGACEKGDDDCDSSDESDSSSSEESSDEEEPEDLIEVEIMEDSGKVGIFKKGRDESELPLLNLDEIVFVPLRELINNMHSKDRSKYFVRANPVSTGKRRRSCPRSSKKEPAKFKVELLDDSYREISEEFAWKMLLQMTYEKYKVHPAATGKIKKMVADGAISPEMGVYLNIEHRIFVKGMNTTGEILKKITDEQQGSFKDPYIVHNHDDAGGQGREENIRNRLTK